MISPPEMTEARRIEQLVVEHEKIARYLADRFSWKHANDHRIDSDELHAEALSSLFKAVRTYNGASKLSSWVYARVQWDLKHYVRHVKMYNHSPRIKRPFIDSLDRDVDSTDSEPRTLGQIHLVEPDFAPSLIDKIQGEGRRRELKEHLSSSSLLTRREKTCVIKTYLDGWTLKKLGHELGVTEARVGQIRKQAIDKLREEFDRKESA